MGLLKLSIREIGVTRGEERWGHALEVHVFVLMDNHYHLLVRTSEPNLSHAIRALGERSIFRRVLETIEAGRDYAGKASASHSL